jgi:hypothetical protein
LEGQRFFRSGFGKSAHIKKQHHGLLPHIVGEADFVSGRRWQFKEGGFITHFEGKSLSRSANE